MDPKPTTGLSLYVAFSNNPILYNDPLGDTSKLPTRIWGAVKGVGGLVEMGVGAAGGAASSWTGLGGLAGGFAFVHGADVSSHGFTEMITGEPAPTYTQQLVSRGLQLGGVPVDKANMVAEFVDAAASIAATAGAAATPRDGTFVVKPLLSPPSGNFPPPVLKGFSFGAEGGFDAISAFKNAISLFKGGNLTNAGRAVTKHPQYFGLESTEALMKVFRSPSALNNLGSSTEKEILRNGVKTTGAGGRYPNGWVTYTLPNGNVASWEASGAFIGFRGILQ